jgi:hypothetical protein
MNPPLFREKPTRFLVSAQVLRTTDVTALAESLRRSLSLLGAVSQPSAQVTPLSTVAPAGESGDAEAVAAVAVADLQDAGLSDEQLALVKLACRECWKAGLLAVERDKLPELAWARYQEFGIPDPEGESFRTPQEPVRIGSIAYRGNETVVYWSPA